MNAKSLPHRAGFFLEKGAVEMRFLNRIYARIKTFRAQNSGATAIEYCLLMVAISLAIATVVQVFGITLTGVFTDLNDTVNEAAGGGS